MIQPSAYKAEVSVIVPIYNQRLRLQRCLDSLCSQEGISLEIICINDGSNDGSDEILRQYSEFDDRFILIDQSNHGAGYSRNRGIEVATGEFVIFCDADDKIPDKSAYSKLYKGAKEHHLKVAAGNFSLIENNARIDSFKDDYFLEGYTFSRDEIIDFIDYQFDYGFQRFMFDLNFLKANRLHFPSYSRYEDPVFLVKALNLARKFYAINDVVYEYHAGHQVYAWEKEKVLDLFKGLSDNMAYSAQHGLSNLHIRTLSRIEIEYGGVISVPIEDEKILESLILLNEKVDWDLIRDGSTKVSIEPGPRVIAPLQRVMDDYFWRVEISKTAIFKIARYITAIPRIIKRKLKSKGERFNVR